MYEIVVNKNIIEICTDKYVLSDWNLNTCGPIGYFVRFVDEIIRHDKAKRILIVGLGAGSVVGELMKRVNTHCHITSIEIDENIITDGYNVLSAYFVSNPLVEHRIIMKDIFLLEENSLEQKFNSIVVDIPAVYEPSSVASKRILFDKILNFSSENSLYIFNTLTHENSSTWSRFLNTEYSAQLSCRPRILKSKDPDGTDHFLLYTLIK